MTSFTIRRMGADDLALACSWAKAEGWNPGQSDALAFQAADPDGFLIGELDGRPVSCISVVRYGSDFGFLGFYIALPAARGRGWGIRIWRQGMAHLEGRLVGLDGVVAQQDNYRRSGFDLAWRNIRYQGPLPASALLRPPAGTTLVAATSLPFDRLAAYDRRFFPAPRPAFLAAWVALPRHIGLVAIRDGEIAGFGVLRPAVDGWKLGPLYAVDAGLAETLLLALRARVPEASTTVVLDVPAFNNSATGLAERLGLVPSFETARMYTGPAPSIDRTGFFGVTSFELG